MKNKILFLLSSILLLSSCGTDNYDAPDCRISGRIVYEGEPLGLRGSGTEDNGLSIELWEHGYGKDMAQIVNVAQNGSFSTDVYGDYPCRIVAKDGMGPWENRHDTVYIDKVTGNMKVDYPVVPYFIIRNVKYVLSSDSVLTANFTIQQISEQANIGTMGLIVNHTKFVDLNVYTDMKSITGTTGNVSISLDIKKMMKEKKRHIYARVFVRNKDITEALYSLEPELIK